MDVRTKNLHAFIVIIGMMLISYGALAENPDTDGSDFLMWQREFGFSPAETLELVYERVDVTTNPSRTFSLEVTNADGGIIGVVELENSVGSKEMLRTGRSQGRGTGRSRGFGFVTMSSAENGVLH